MEKIYAFQRSSSSIIGSTSGKVAKCWVQDVSSGIDICTANLRVGVVTRCNDQVGSGRIGVKGDGRRAGAEDSGAVG